MLSVVHTRGGTLGGTLGNTLGGILEEVPGGKSAVFGLFPRYALFAAALMNLSCSSLLEIYSNNLDILGGCAPFSVFFTICLICFC